MGSVRQVKWGRCGCRGHMRIISVVLLLNGIRRLLKATKEYLIGIFFDCFTN